MFFGKSQFKIEFSLIWANISRTTSDMNSIFFNAV